MAKRRTDDRTLAEKMVRDAGGQVRGRDLALKVVDDPMDAGRVRKSVVNRRECALDMLLKRRAINETQHAAGVRVRDLFERAEIGGAQAIDYGRGRVDGGQRRSDLSDMQCDAMARLNMLAIEIGKTAFPILVAVCAENKALTTVADERGWHKRTPADLIRVALDEAAVVLGLVVHGRSR